MAEKYSDVAVNIPLVKPNPPAVIKAGKVNAPTPPVNNVKAKAAPVPNSAELSIFPLFLSMFCYPAFALSPEKNPVEGITTFSNSFICVCGNISLAFLN